MIRLERFVGGYEPKFDKFLSMNDREFLEKLFSVLTCLHLALNHYDNDELKQTYEDLTVLYYKVFLSVYSK